MKAYEYIIKYYNIVSIFYIIIAIFLIIYLKSSKNTLKKMIKTHPVLLVFVSVFMVIHLIITVMFCVFLVGDLIGYIDIWH